MIVRSCCLLLAPVLGVCLTFSLHAQSVAPVCGAPPVADEHAQPNIFSLQQEEWWGDASADRLESENSPIHDAALNAHVQAIADRLAATLPGNRIRFRVTIVDSSEINGSSIAGGHIYLTRKLVALAANDDELASVLGHEMGHIASHQFAFETTRDLRRLLNIASVSDRTDIYAKFQQLMDARMKDKHPQPTGDDDIGQGEADKIGIYVIAAAGYRPQAMADFWNRVFFVGGRTGGRISDFFGFTKPDEKRLRGMLALAATLQKGCGAEKSEPTAEFLTWHRAIVANQTVSAAANLPAALKEVTLNPAVRMDLDRLRFSPDGKTILAQDEGSIFVLSRDPLAVEFRMDAEDALPAEFTPDSAHIVFSTPGLHTEEWSIADKKLVTAQEVITRETCLQSRLSPDGRTLVCITIPSESPQLNLSVIDVATGNLLWEKKPLYTPNFLGILELMFFRVNDPAAELVPMRFSPDAHYMLIGPADAKIAIDMRTREQVKIGGGLKGDVIGDYAFVANDKVVGQNSELKNSGIYSFPDGRQLQKLMAPPGRLGSFTASDNMALTYGVPEYAVGVVDFSTNKFIGLKTRAVDIWNGILLAESYGGTVNTLKAFSDDKTLEKKITLPIGPLAEPRSVSLSPDGKYLALSTRFRGGVWEMETGKRIATLNGFTGVEWGAQNNLFIDMVKHDKLDRHVAKVVLNPPSLTDLTYTVDDHSHMRYNMLLEWKDNGKKAKDLILHNPADNSPQWSRTFPDGQETYTANAGERELIFNYQLKSPVAKEHLKANGTLSAQAQALKDKDLGRLIEIVDASTGKTIAEVVLELPLRFVGTDGLNRIGDQLFVTSGDNRTMSYSLATGKQIRQLFGYVIAIDPEARRVCTVNRRDEAVIYDGEGREVAHFHMGSPIRFARFRDGGKVLMLLTADQKMRTMDLSKPTQVAETK